MRGRREEKGSCAKEERGSLLAWCGLRAQQKCGRAGASVGAGLVVAREERKGGAALPALSSGSLFRPPQMERSLEPSIANGRVVAVTMVVVAWWYDIARSD